MKLKVFLKSGNSFEFECDEWTSSSGQATWTHLKGQTKNKLIRLDIDQVEAIVRLS